MTLALTACGNDDGDSGSNSSNDGGSSALPPSLDVPAPDPGWALMAGDVDDDWGLDLVADTEGNAYAVGYFQNAIDFGAEPLSGAHAAFVTSVAADGASRWSRAFSGQGSSEAWGVAEANGYVYVAGEVGGEVDFGLGSTTGSEGAFVACLSAATGETAWAERFGLAGQFSARRVAATGSAVYVFGEFDGSGDLFGASLASAGSDDVYVAAFDTSGNGTWARGFGSEGADDVGGVTVSFEEGPVISGRAAGSIDFGSGAMGSDGQAFVVSLAADGSERWAKSLASPDLARAWDVAADDAGNLYVTGEFRDVLDLGAQKLTSAGGSDVFLASYDDAGELRFAWRFGDVKDADAGPTYQSGVDTGLGVAVGADGNVYVTGSFQLTIDFGGGPLTYVGGGGDTDIFVASFDSAGNHRWSSAFGAERGESGWGIAASAGGQVFVLGRSLNALDFGTGPLTNAGEDDVFLVRLDP